MTTSNDSKPQVSSKKSVPADNTLAPAPTAVRGSTAHWYIISLLLLIALGGAGFAVYSNLQLRQQTNQDIQQLSSKMATLTQDHSNALAKIAVSAQQAKNSQVKLQNRFKALRNNLQTTLQQHRYQANDWLLLKARYYLELAQINAHWSNDLQTTTALLQQADELLVQIPNQQLFAVRQAIAKEIAQVQSIPKIDTAGILSQLDAAQTILIKLPIKKSTAADSGDKTTSANSTPSWRQRLQDNMGLLQKLVIIRHHDSEVRPLLGPEREGQIRENIRLTLQEAQWAVLQNNEALFQLLLAQAIKNINLQFAPNDTGTQTLLKQLQTLQQIHLVQQLPVLDQSLPLLNKVINANETKPVAPPATGEASS